MFMRKFGESVTGVVSGFDRLVFRGTLRSLSYAAGLAGYLSAVGVLLKDFGRFAETRTQMLKDASLAEARRLDRPVRYLASSKRSKEDIARCIVSEDGVREGLVCVLTSVEPCWSYEVYRDREAKRLSLEPRRRKCLFLYHYWMDAEWGLMNARIQSWFPFAIQVCLNGRERLARQMDKAGLAYERADNCFVRLEDPIRAQQLLDEQLKTDWPRWLDQIATRLNPAHEQILLGNRRDYYWSTYQSEWASDVMFRSPEDLAAIYPKLTRAAVLNFGSEQVMRYLRDVKLRSFFEGQVVSDLRKRDDAVRLKHWVNNNSLKMYDKHGRVLRVETTINDPADFKSYRQKEGDPDGPKSWRAMRCGVADLHRRAEVSQAANHRYLEALGSLGVDETLGESLDPVCRPTRWKGARVRALRPWHEQDLDLLRAVARGEFAINGFRNRDLRILLYGATENKSEQRRRSSRVTRQMRLLRAHGLIRKIPHTHRYVLTPKGRVITAATINAQTIPIKEVVELAA